MPWGALSLACRRRIEQSSGWLLSGDSYVCPCFKDGPHFNIDTCVDTLLCLWLNVSTGTVYLGKMFSCLLCKHWRLNLVKSIDL